MDRAKIDAVIADVQKLSQRLDALTIDQARQRLIGGGKIKAGGVEKLVERGKDHRVKLLGNKVAREYTRELAADPDRWERIKIASNPNITDKVFKDGRLVYGAGRRWDHQKLDAAVSISQSLALR